jgi:hypothetical protein
MKRTDEVIDVAKTTQHVARIEEIRNAYKTLF